MNTTALATRIELYTPAGWQFKAYQYQGHYNTEKQVGNVMIMTLPATWPSRWRENCSYRLAFNLWFGQMVPVKQTTTGTQNAKPYTSLEFLDGMLSTAQATLRALAEDPYISLVNEPVMTWLDSPQAGSINSQAWLQVPVEVDVWPWLSVLPLTYNGQQLTYNGQLITYLGEDQQNVYVTNEGGEQLVDEYGNEIIL